MTDELKLSHEQARKALRRFKKKAEEAQLRGRMVLSGDQARAEQAKDRRVKTIMRAANPTPLAISMFAALHGSD